MAERRELRTSAALRAPSPLVNATSRTRPSEDDVRELVRRVVDAVLDARSTAPSPASPVSMTAPSSPAAATAPAPAVAAAASGSGRIAVGADHGGVRLKDLIAQTLRGYGYDVTDCGTNSTDAVDYPDFAHAVARLVADGTCSAGIVVDGAGIGSCIAANKVPGVRAALCYDISSARNSREHNHANVLTLGARLIGDGLALEIVRTWLGTAWGGARHGARVDKITEIERRYMRPQAGDAR